MLVLALCLNVQSFWKHDHHENLNKTFGFSHTSLFLHGIVPRLEEMTGNIK